ncbi:MAG TPA: ABC transporter permease subunit, partial [Solirubrobacteraceae bacterium]|nr:ABC transporter permease subunit [Solirubrobacteraceae bacterium]
MPRSPAAHVARRQLARLRRGAIILGVVAGVVVAVTIVSYVGAYPTRADRIELARGLAASSGFTALLGQPSGIDTLAGFLQWRMQTFLGLVGGIWGLLVATRAVRGEEESGHLELELAGPVGRRAAVAAAGAALAGGVAIVW